MAASRTGGGRAGIGGTVGDSGGAARLTPDRRSGETEPAGRHGIGSQLMVPSDNRTRRSPGGPGSSEQNANKPEAAPETRPNPDEPTNQERSRVSGGGGERDIHHTHDPAHKR